MPYFFYLRVLDGRREGLREHIKLRDIDTGICWQPGHRFSLLSECRHGGLDVTDRIGCEILTIPFHSAMVKDASSE